MAGENSTPVMASTEDWDIAEQASLSALKSMGLDDNKSVADTKDRFNVWRQKNQHTKQQVQALTDLFLEKKKLAGLVGTNVVGIGNAAATTNIQSQQKAPDAATALGQLAKATDIETTAITNKFYAGWVGPITMLGKLLNACGATELGEKCIAFAQDIAPSKIETKSAEAAMKARQEAVTIDASAPTRTALSVLNAAMLTTEADNIGMGASGGAKVQEQISAVTKANANTASKPASVAVNAAPAPISSASTANIAALSADIVAFDKSKKGAMTDKDVAAQVKSLLNIDNSSAGNHDGKLSTAKEAESYKKSTAYLALPAGEKKIMDMFIDDSLKQKAVAAPAGPAPVLN